MSFVSKNNYRHESPPLRAELVVRPDVLRVSLSVSVEMEQHTQALPLLQRTCEQVQRRLREVSAAEVSFRPRDARFNRASTTKKLALADDEITFISVEGLLEVPLPAEMDFWARSARVGAVVRACHEAERDSKHSRKVPQLGFGSVDALVARPEAHRAELLRRAVAHARELAEAAGAPGAPLYVVDCSAPDAVEQTAGSLEEVGLSLHVHCRLGVLQAPATGTGAGPGH